MFCQRLVINLIYHKVPLPNKPPIHTFFRRTHRTFVSNYTEKNYESLKKERYEDTIGCNDDEDRLSTTDTSKVYPEHLQKPLAILREALGGGNFKRAVERVQRYKFRPDERTFALLLDQISSVSQLNRVSDSLGVPVSPFIRNLWFRRLLERSGTAYAIKMYAELKKHGLPRDWAVAERILYSLAGGGISHPTDATLDSALNVYYNARHADQSNARVGLPSASTDELMRGYFHKSFNSLFRALSYAQNRAMYFPIAKTLLHEAIGDGYKMDKYGASFMAVMLIRSAPSHADALNAYREFRAENHGLFDSDVYNTILITYCTLERPIGKSSIPPLLGCFEILEDMKKDNYQINAKQYSIILKHYTTAVNAIRTITDRNTRFTLQKAFLDVVERTYDHLMTRSTVLPNITLFTQFLNLYSRLGHFPGVVQMWGLICSLGKIDNAAISCIFDACGQAGAYTLALEVRRKLNLDGVVMNRNNWSSWLECLCRLDKLDEAVRQLIHKSPRDAEGNLDSLSVQMVLSFATRAGKLEEVQRQLSDHSPGLRVLKESSTRMSSAEK